MLRISGDKEIREWFRDKKRYLPDPPEGTLELFLPDGPVLLTGTQALQPFEETWVPIIFMTEEEKIKEAFEEGFWAGNAHGWYEGKWGESKTATEWLAEDWKAFLNGERNLDCK